MATVKPTQDYIDSQGQIVARSGTGIPSPIKTSTKPPSLNLNIPKFDTRSIKTITRGVVISLDIFRIISSVHNLIRGINAAAGASGFVFDQVKNKIDQSTAQIISASSGDELDLAREEINKSKKQIIERGEANFSKQSRSKLTLIADFGPNKNREQVDIQFVPTELEYDPISSFAEINSFARNNPLYHYTGSEDVLTFTLDWHAENDDREDVIKKCKLLESWTKNDGFINPPPTITLLWGALFTESKWLLVHAPYKISNWVDNAITHMEINDINGSLISYGVKRVGMLPMQAYQYVTLKRITEGNRTKNEIQRFNS